jgi:hypothetical protein
MKKELQILIAVLSIVLSMAEASAQQPPQPPQPPQAVPIDPATGLPLPQPAAVDPTTGLPLDGSPPFKDTNGVPTWISPSWKDPDKVLDNADFRNLPLTEVARQLQEQIVQRTRRDYFDVIFPNNSTMAVNNPGTGLSIVAFDPTQIYVDLRLKNVKASEIFSAMNTQFELNRSPLRWELTLNGSRPTAILRIVWALGPQAPSELPPPPQIRKVFFVGDMLDEYPGTNDVDKLGDISSKLNDAWEKTEIRGGKVQIYPAGQLLIVSGTPDQVDLAEQILHALKDKAAHDKIQSQPSPPVKSQ